MSPFFQGSETNLPTYFLSVLNTANIRLYLNDIDWSFLVGWAVSFSFIRRRKTRIDQSNEFDDFLPPGISS